MAPPASIGFTKMKIRKCSYIDFAMQFCMAFFAIKYLVVASLNAIDCDFAPPGVF